MIPQWQSQGYTHFHFGAIRLALSYHGRKGLPVTTNLALLDTRYLCYQDACIGTIETTLNAGTTFFTLFPNFNIALSDKYLSTALKVQLHTVRAPQVRDPIVAILHYQMVYRVQNHALDIMLPQSSNDALLITVDSHHVPSCVHIPKQISRDKLIQLLPEAWITNYEKLHQHQEPIRSSEPTFTKAKDGLVESGLHMKNPLP